MGSGTGGFGGNFLACKDCDNTFLLDLVGNEFKCPKYGSKDLVRTNND
jgi:hypothetical protein